MRDMTINMRACLANLGVLALICFAASHSFGAPVVDGVLTPGEYSTGLLAEQDTESNFNSLEFPCCELDAAYGIIEGGSLYLMITGNFTGFNNLNIFFDSVSAGQNTLLGGQGGNPKFDAQGPSVNGPGLTFEPGFEADYSIWYNGNDGVSGTDGYIDYVPIGAGNETIFLAGDVPPLNPTLTIGGGGAARTATDGTHTITGVFAYDNSNTAGIDDGSGTGPVAPGVGATATHGFEASIDLASLGNPTGDVKVFAYLNNNGNVFTSNQFLPGIGGGGSPGTPEGRIETVDLSTIAGQQFFTIVNPNASIPGDFDGNGVVNGDDLAQWQGDYGANGNSDGDADGDSDGADFLIWQGDFDGLPSPLTSVVAVPEPSSMVCAGLLVLSMLFVPRRKCR